MIQNWPIWKPARGPQWSWFRFHGYAPFWGTDVGPLTVALWTPNRRSRGSILQKEALKKGPRTDSLQGVKWYIYMYIYIYLSFPLLSFLFFFIIFFFFLLFLLLLLLLLLLLCLFLLILLFFSVSFLNSTCWGKEDLKSKGAWACRIGSIGGRDFPWTRTPLL